MDAMPRRFFFKEAEERFSEQPFMVTSDGIFTYHQVSIYVFKTTLRLREAGIKKGDRIAILASNSMEYVILLIALWKMGAIAVPISTRLAQKQVVDNLRAIESSVIITTKEYSILKLPLDMSLFILEDLISLRSLSSCGVNLDYNESYMDQNATIIFTSGSSGRPKAVLHRLGNHLFSALGSNRNIMVAPGDRWLLSLPLYHVGGLAIIFRVILSGGAIAIPITDFLLEDNIHKLQITHVSLVSTQLYRLLKNCKNFDNLNKLKTILVGGSVIPDSLIREGFKHGLPICKSYGSSEMASQVTTTRLNDSREKFLSSGTLLDYRQMKIIENNEIILKGKTLFRGYVEGKRIIRAVDEEGWFHSGDLGYLDKDGYLFVTGRKDNMFISGGENIQPEEIETCLAQIDGIKEAIVVPVKHREFGHRPAAFLKTEHYPSLKRHYIIKNLEEMLPRFKIPDYFFPWPEEGRQGILKPDRSYLRKIAGDLVQRKASSQICLDGYMISTIEREIL